MAKKSKNNNALILIGLIVLAIYLMNGGGSRSAIAVPSCQIPFGGGECVVNVTVPADRAASLMKFQLDFASVPGEEFIGRTPVTAFASGGPWTEEDGEQYDDTCREDREHYYVALYRIPAEFPDVYELYFEVETTATGQIDETFSSADINIYAEYINIPYPYNNIQLCTKDDRDDCSNGDVAIVHTYTYDGSSSTYGDYSEDRVNIRHEIGVTGQEREDLYVDVGLDSPLNQPVSAPIWARGVVPNSALNLEGMTRSNFALMAEINAEEDSRCGVDISRAVNPPEHAYISYKPAEWPTDITYSLGDGPVIETFTGSNKEMIETLDIADQVNIYCNRERNIDECNVQLTFKSSTGGLVTVTEESTLKIATLPDADNDGVYDFDDNCVDVSNPDQSDKDYDGLGDACDVLNNLDGDEDGVPNANDNCVNIANPAQSDMDNDGIGDACDSIDDTDTDNDTVPDVIDNCINDENTGQLDTDNDGLGDVCDNDADGDGIYNADDNCPQISNANQRDSDGDTKGDVCDSTPNGGTTDNGDNTGDGADDDTKDSDVTVDDGKAVPVTNYIWIAAGLGAAILIFTITRKPGKKGRK